MIKKQKQKTTTYVYFWGLAHFWNDIPVFKQIFPHCFENVWGLNCLMFGNERKIAFRLIHVKVKVILKKNNLKPLQLTFSLLNVSSIWNVQVRWTAASL